jgi:hypothetical protein
LPNDLCRIVLFQLLNCSVYLVLIVVMAWRNFKMEQRSVLVFADIVAVLSAAATATTSTPPAACPPAPSLFSLHPQVFELVRGLMLKCSPRTPPPQLEQQRRGYTHLAALCNYVRDACASSIADFDSEDAAKQGCAGCTLLDVRALASDLLQRLTIMEAAKASAHHLIFGTAVDTTLLLSVISFVISGVVSGLSTYGK